MYRVCFKDLNVARHWIRLKHTGQNNGIGVVTWDTIQQKRFLDAQSEVPSITTQILSFVENNFDEEVISRASKVPSTNLERLLKDPRVRARLGFKLEKGILTSDISPDEGKKGISRIITDFSTGRYTVKDIYYKEDRRNYLDSFPEEELPDLSRTLDKPWTIIAEGEKTLIEKHLTSKPTKQVKQEKKASSKRRTLIPGSFRLVIENDRINGIYRELKTLSVEDYVNSVAVLFRVFIELSVDEYLLERKLKGRGEWKQ